jgi:hypothetical protein
VDSHTQQYAAAVEAIRRRIVDARRAATESASEFDAAELQAGLRLEAERAKVESGAASALAEFRHARVRDGRAMDAAVADCVRARDRARKEFVQQAARGEEQDVIHRLERALSLRTQELVALGKDLLSFRHKLITQEGEYNCRFGVDPSVAVLAPMTPERKRPATTLGRRLPRLSVPGTGP